MSLNAAQSANPVAQRKMEPIPAFEQFALPVALQKNMGILSMKVMGQGMLVGNGAGRASSSELLQFNLSQPVASVVIGCEQIGTLSKRTPKRLNTLYADERKRETQAPRKSRPVAFSVGEFPAIACGLGRGNVKKAQRNVQRTTRIAQVISCIAGSRRGVFNVHRLWAS